MLEATKILLPSELDIAYKHLIIIPALTIGTFPFYILQPYKDSTSLIDKCSYSIAPGLIDLISIRYRSIKQISGQDDYDSNAYNGSICFTLDSPMFVCNPVYPTNTSFELPNLPCANKEISNALHFAKKFNLLEDTLSNVINVIKGLRNCDVAYLATHGVANQNNPMDSSFIVLSGNEHPFFTARDIMNLRDSVDAGNRYPNKFPQMTILSACQTGLGKSMEAGVTGLASSFLITGSNQVIMSLWSVDDEATSYLMNRFLYYLQKPGLFCPSEPLRQAELDTKKLYPDPVKWASFSVFGVDY